MSKNNEYVLVFSDVPYEEDLIGKGMQPPYNPFAYVDAITFRLYGEYPRTITEYRKLAYKVLRAWGAPRGTAERIADNGDFFIRRWEETVVIDERTKQ